jgi:hypothetical protein
MEAPANVAARAPKSYWLGGVVVAGGWITR